MPESVMERLQRIEEQRKQLLAAASQELKARYDELVRDYERLNIPFPGGGRDRAKSRTTDPERPCGVCGFATIPNHDGRHHRGQAKKKAFTDEELGAKGWKKKR